MIKDNIQIVVASKNRDKLGEIKEILKGFPCKIVSMNEVGFTDEIEENGNTFEENALIKARAIYAKIGGYVIADDSGLSIDALNGAPGIYSARFGGEQATYKSKINKIWKMLKQTGSQNRNAQFICVVAVIKPDGSEWTVRGECKGQIYDRIVGDNGFGYDPVFYIPEFGMTTAQMSPEKKHQISHRGIALRKMAEKLRKEQIIG